MLAYIRRASITAWKFLILPSLKCLTVGGLFLAAWVTIVSFQLLFIFSLPDEKYHSTTQLIFAVDVVLLYVFIIFLVVFFEERAGEDVPNLKKFFEAKREEFVPKAEEGAISLSTENTPGSLSLVDRRALSLHTKDPA